MATNNPAKSRAGFKQQSQKPAKSSISATERLPVVEALRIAAGDPAWTNGDLEDVSGRLESEVTPAKVDAAFCVPWIDPSDGTVFIGELNVMDEAQMNLFRPGSHEVITKIRFSEWMAAPGTLLMLSLNLSLASRILGSSDDDATFVLALAITWAAATGCTWFTMNPLSDVGKHFRKKQKYKDGDEKTPMSDTAIFKSSKMAYVAWPSASVAEQRSHSDPGSQALPRKLCSKRQE